MPRPQIDLSTVQEEITGLHRDGSSINTIRTHLLEHHQLQTGDFFVKHDDFMLKRLRDEGFTISKFPLQVARERARSFLTARHRSLQRYKDMAGTISIRICASNIILLERWGRTRYTRRDFSIHGPDWVWSIDGYDKLKNWGFEIYAGIDATSWNVAKQYLHVLNQRHAMPRILRSDHGNETSSYAGYIITYPACERRNRALISSQLHLETAVILFDISQIVHTFEAGNLRSYIISLILLVNRIMPRRSHRIGFAYAPSFSMRIPRT
ncbi:hypothetical protein HRG_014305 [Hirsutella rhossiliensis]